MVFAHKFSVKIGFNPFGQPTIWVWPYQNPFNLDWVSPWSSDPIDIPSDREKAWNSRRSHEVVSSHEKTWEAW